MLVLQAYAFDMIGDSVNTLLPLLINILAWLTLQVKAYDFELYGLNHKRWVTIHCCH
ncbi:MAG: hypothetical protein IPG53_17155 [Ignavibacteriales bacterium]|nr:hypothetical protein [Ignavibacteriales bacterium]